VDLVPARDKIVAARESGAEQAAPDPLARSEAHLKEAESLAASQGKGAAERARDAEFLVRLSATEAEWAAAVATARSAPPPPAARCEDTSSERADIESRAHRAEEEQRRLEEWSALLMRELELAETEVVRAKAKVSGQSKAEASSAIAEARILLRRMSDEKVKSRNMARCQELVDRAEALLEKGDVTRAVALAMTAQDLVEHTRRLATDPAALDHPPVKTAYVALGPVNIRQGPATSEPVVGQVPKGASVEGRSQRGDWLLVAYGRIEGWVYGPLLR
jgi:uncharacterized protein YgiM (DUF1202 family)